MNRKQKAPRNHRVTIRYCVGGNINKTVRAETFDMTATEWERLTQHSPGAIPRHQQEQENMAVDTHAALAALDGVHAEVREFWDRLERALERNPNADKMTDLLGEYRHLAEFINDDAAENHEHRTMLENAVAIERGSQLGD